MSDKKVTVEKKESEEAVMYLGPTFTGVAHASVFTNGITAPMEEKVKAHPFFAELLIPLNGIVAARVAMEDPGSALSRCYAAAKDIVDKEG